MPQTKFKKPGARLFIISVACVKPGLRKIKIRQLSFPAQYSKTVKFYYRKIIMPYGIPVPRVYLKYIPVVSFDVRCESGICIYIKFKTKCFTNLHVLVSLA